MPKVFLTGATGFIGGRLVDYLLEAGYSVRVLVRDKNKISKHSWKDKVEIICGDILNPKSFEGKMHGCDVIIHSAALISFNNKIWDTVHEVNVNGTKNIVQEALKANPKKFIHISSVAAVGISEDGNPINENHPYNFSKLNICYMETKHLAEEEVKKGIEKGLNACFVNPANVWGAGDYHGRRTLIIKLLKMGLPFYVNAATNFVDVDAVCPAIINAIDKGKKGERYILGGENLTIKEFLSIICDELKIKRPFICVPKFIVLSYAYFIDFLSEIFGFTPRPTLSQMSLIGPNVYYDSSKAIKELNMPIITIQDSIKKTVRFYRDNGLL